MRPPLLHRVLLSVLPAFVLAALVLAAIGGEHGLMRRAELSRELDEANAELRATQRENTRMLRDLRLLEEDPVAIERAVASELGRGLPGATLYRFDGPTSAPDAVSSQP